MPHFIMTASPSASPSENAARRLLAEARLGSRMPTELPPMLPHEILRQLHELQVHQIEVELQNEDLDRLQAQEVATRARYRDLYDFAPVGYVTLIGRGEIAETNLAAAQLLGEERLRLQGKHFALFVAAADLAIFTAFLQQVFLTHAPQDCEITLISSRQKLRYVHLKAAVSADGLECRLALVDLSERRHAEAALRATKNHLAITLDAIADAVITLDANRRITHLNQRAETLTGYTAATAVGSFFARIVSLLDAETRAGIESSAVRLLRLPHAGPEPEPVPKTRLLLLDRLGQEHLVIEKAVPIRGEDGVLNGVVLVLHDVTEQQLLEDQLHQAQHLHAVGRLAGGIAHDFNNMLAVVSGASELLSLTTAGNPACARPLQMLFDTVSRARDLTDKLRGFSRRGNQLEQTIDLHREIDNLVTLFRRTVDQRIRFITALDAHLPLVLGDSGMLMNLMLNLCLNSRDAMPEGGTLTLSTTDVAADAPELVRQQLAPVEHLAITFSDTGSGLPPVVKEHLFEPFVTTKEVGKGTGLGLASVYSAVKRHHGAIIVNSELNQGTTIRILLPCCLNCQAPTTHAQLPKMINLNGQTVLVADDEPILRELLATHLEALGATVIKAEDGLQAMNLFAADPQRYSLVILDQAMPSCNGSTVFRAIRQIRPEMRVVIASGYLDEHERDALEREGLSGFLPKPYTLAELLHLLSDHLLSDHLLSDHLLSDHLPSDHLPATE
jgi:two-component system cell cycle sensor histidine kinase/response regulator CckA